MRSISRITRVWSFGFWLLFFIGFRADAYNRPGSVEKLYPYSGSALPSILDTTPNGFGDVVLNVFEQGQQKILYRKGSEWISTDSLSSELPGASFTARQLNDAGDVILCDIKDKDSVKPLIVEFERTFFAIFSEANQDGLGFRVQIDGKPVPYVVPKKPAADDWPNDTARLGAGNLFKFVELSEDLAPGKHTLEIHPEFPEGVKKGQLRIESLCVAGPVH